MEELKKNIEKRSNQMPESLGGKLGFMTGALSTEAKEYWQKGMYTEEEVLQLLHKYTRHVINQEIEMAAINSEKWFEQNKKKS